MKRLIKNEKGYTLILTVAIIVIFTVLGLSLLMLTSSGIKKNENRQNTVQAQDLSDKGIKYAVDDLQHYLEDEIKNNPMGKTQFYNLLENTIKVNCPDGIEIPGEKASQTKVCIDRVEMISNEEKDQYKRLVTFKSTGLVNGKTQTTSSKVIIGTDTIPDQLRYAISTNDGGDLYLHGGVEIQGDIKTDGNLIITKNAHWMSGNTAKWEDSVGPRLIKDIKSVTPKIIMKENGKNIYTVDGSDTLDFNSHISNTKDKYGNYYLDRSFYQKLSPIDENTITLLKKNNLFSTPNLNIVTKSMPADQIDVLAKIKEKNVGIVDYQYDDLHISSTENPTINYTKDKTILVGEKEKVCSNWFLVCLDWKETGNYIGDMIIDANNSKNYVPLKGSYYVNGDLTINDTNLKSDALIYVKGDVNIKDSTLQGLNPDSTLIIFANGNIQISNISVGSSYDHPSTIKGFFYSKSNMIMYGVGSNIRLTGGISSKRLILTALRGNTLMDNYGSVVSSDSIDNQKLRDSRLKVTYDENLIKQYTSFLRDEKEEYITQLNDPEYIERSN